MIHSPYTKAHITNPDTESAVQQGLSSHLMELISLIYKALLMRIDPNMVVTMLPAELEQQTEEFVADFIASERIHINRDEQRLIAVNIVNDLIGLGPLESLLKDDNITDIMVNAPDAVYIERKGKLQKSHISFRDHDHILQIAQRIASRIGRHVDESSPMVDARLSDGSRVHIIIPPVSLNGPVISIRKFSKMAIDIDTMVKQKNISEIIARFLRIAATCRLNILVSGGTGSGKTTMLNAISQLINRTERILTIEDAAELRLQQPHVVRLETRTSNIEGEGCINIRELLRNALRMRPDRIIVGEVRGDESIDMLQAMNTGHDGSMSTIHANRAEEALWRLENMISMSDANLPSKAIRAQIVGGIDLVIQIERMRDGVRRIKEIIEIVALDDEVIRTQALFKFEYEGEDQGNIKGEFMAQKAEPNFIGKARFFGLDQELKQMMEVGNA